MNQPTGQLTDIAAFALGELWLQAQKAFLDWVLIKNGSEAHQLRHNTRQAYEEALRLFFGGHPEMLALALYFPLLPWDVRPEDARRWQKAMLILGNSNRTINQRLAAGLSFYRFVRSRHMLPPTPELLELKAATGLLHWSDREQRSLLLWPPDLGNPFDPDVVDRQPVSAYDKKRVPTQDEVQRLLARIDRTSLVGLRDYALFFTIITTARRISEITGLKWGDIRPGPNNDYIFKYRCKGGEIKESNFGPAVYEAVTAYLGAAGRLAGIQPEHYIFTAIEKVDARRYKTNPLIPLPYGAVQTALKRYGKLAGANLQNLHLHGLRHRSAKDWVADKKAEGKGVDYHELQKKLGHRDIGTTLIYGGSVLEDPTDPSLPALEERYGQPIDQPTNQSTEEQ